MIVLTLPFPPRDLSPNARPNRWVRAKTVQNYRYECKVEALKVRDRKTIALQAPVKARVTFICGSRLWDEDNCVAAFKAGWETHVIKGKKRQVCVVLEAGK